MPHGGRAVTQASSQLRHDLGAALLGALLILLWEMSGLDIGVMRGLGDAHGFALRDAWWTSGLLHEGGRVVAASLLGALAWDAIRPKSGGPALSQRWCWLAATLACMLLVSTIKRHSPTSCPWDLAEFGGHAMRLSHWRFDLRDGGGGRCFPSGHASAAFAFFGAYFLWRGHRPVAARLWLIGTGLVGMLFGLGQVARGAHFPSHVFWTAWLCWMVCALLAMLLSARTARQSARLELLRASVHAAG